MSYDDKISLLQGQLIDLIKDQTELEKKQEIDVETSLKVRKVFNERIEKLEKALEEGSAVAFHGTYHTTINRRLKNLFNALEMNLNGIKAERIEKLEKDTPFKAHDIELIHNVRKELSELKEQLEKHNTNEEFWKNSIVQISDKKETVEEVLRDFFRTLEIAFDENRKLIPTPDWTAIAKHALDKLGDSKPPSECPICHDSGKLNDGGSIVGCYKCGKDWRINSRDAIYLHHVQKYSDLNPSEPSARQTDCTHKYTSFYPYWECGKCGYMFPYEMNKNVPFTKILVEKEDLEWVFAWSFPVGTERAPKWNAIRDKYLKEEKE